MQDGDSARNKGLNDAQASTRSNLIGIGALSKATGIPVETIRTWERRYSFPSPQRTATGHRLYDLSVIEHLQWITRALSMGHRASQMLRLSLDDVRALVVGRETVPAVASRGTTVEGQDVLTRWMHAVREMNESKLARGFATECARLGALEFAETRAAPFLTEVGRAWSDGELSVSHEHFASERLRDFLSALWRSLRVPDDAPCALLTTLPGEQHHLGLHLAAVAVSLAGLKVMFLGSSTPVEDLAATARRKKVNAVVVSISTAMPKMVSAALLRALAAELPDSIQLVAGGSGAPRDVQGAHYPSSLVALNSWAAEMVG
jgi:DNA-binding transcriptional MerR regulator/methylmalonyl-CoA mutase cobalamin-binding subunit